MPHIGQQMLFYPAQKMHRFKRMDNQPFAAVVVFVHDKSHVNLCITDHHGDDYFVPQVEIRGDADDARRLEPEVSFCECQPVRLTNEEEE